MERRWAQSTDRTWCEGRVGLATACRRLPGGSSAASFNQTRGEALPRPYPATPRAAHNFPGPPRDLFVPSSNGRDGMNDQGRPNGSPLVGTQCRGEALPRPYPAAPRAVHNFPGPPRDLFVPSTNGRVGMNDQGRGTASPLSGGAPRRPQFPRPASRFVCSEHERGHRHERPGATQWVARTLGHNVGARHCLALIRRRPAPPTISQACLAICLFRARTGASA